MDSDSKKWPERRGRRASALCETPASDFKMKLAHVWPAGLIVSLLLSIPGLPVALAHSRLVESVPADREHLQKRPGEVILRFNEPVDYGTARILDSS